MRIPRPATACGSLPVVSAVLRRSPVEARCVGEVAISDSPLVRDCDLRVARQQPHNVIVHNVSEQHQEEHKSNLHEALFERQAEIAAANGFHRQQKNVASIEDGNRQQIQDAEVQADHGHQIDGVHRTLLNRLARLYRNPYEALQLPDGQFAGEEPANYADKLAGGTDRFIRGFLHRGAKTHSFEGPLGSRRHSNPPNRLPVFILVLHRMNCNGQVISVASYDHVHRLPIGLPDGIEELEPAAHGRSIDGDDSVSALEACAAGRLPRFYAANQRWRWQVTQNTVRVAYLPGAHFNRLLCTLMFDAETQSSRSGSLQENIIHL